ncbi:MAG: hypothetical protein WCK32_07145 [Chlorobiaceae bacterium]
MSAKSEWYRVIPFKLLVFLLLVFSPITTASAAKEVLFQRITVTLIPDTVLVGDRIRCLIGVKHQTSEVAALEGFDAMSKQQFELISQKKVSSLFSSDTGMTRFELELAVFGIGRQNLPPFTVALRDSEGHLTKKEIYTPTISVFVKALTDSSMHDLRPIKPPEKPSIPFFLLFSFIVAVLGIAVAVLVFLFLLKRAVSKSAERIDPGYVAQRKLRKLGLRLSAGMPAHECYEELSNIMRSFLENHYRIRALEAVTQEIERDLKKLDVAGFESIMNLLKQADLVKFADARPNIEESRQSLQKAEEIIRSTQAHEK